MSANNLYSELREMAKLLGFDPDTAYWEIRKINAILKSSTALAKCKYKVKHSVATSADANDYVVMVFTGRRRSLNSVKDVLLRNGIELEASSTEKELRVKVC